MRKSDSQTNPYHYSNLPEHNLLYLWHALWAPSNLALFCIASRFTLGDVTETEFKQDIN